MVVFVGVVGGGRKDNSKIRELAKKKYTPAATVVSINIYIIYCLEEEIYSCCHSCLDKRWQRRCWRFLDWQLECLVLNIPRQQREFWRYVDCQRECRRSSDSQQRRADDLWIEIIHSKQQDSIIDATWCCWQISQRKHVSILTYFSRHLTCQRFTDLCWKGSFFSQH